MTKNTLQGRAHLWRPHARIAGLLHVVSDQVVADRGELAHEGRRLVLRRVGRRRLSLYKILFHFKALVWESNTLLLPPPHTQSLPYFNSISGLLRNIRPPTDRPCLCHTPYNIGDGNIV